MLWIGLTGGLASGKSSVAEILKKQNISVINADQLARDAVVKGSPGLAQIVSHFGNEILGPDGSLDRKILATKVFGQKSSLETLESIIHPVVRALALEAREKLEKQGEKVAFYDVPLLIEKNMQSLFNSIVVVTTTEENQLRRAILRDKSNEKDVRARLKFQTSMQEKIKFADYVIENNGTFEELEKKVLHVLKEITNPKNSPGLK